MQRGDVKPEPCAIQRKQGREISQDCSQTTKIQKSRTSATETQEWEQLYMPLKICSSISMAKQKATTLGRNPAEYIIGTFILL
ncbi:hypothetical protein RchiOBHm_Chr1g0353801 [Rosa chinensis]|uniref:Uncharacterized protein n=2 Tax=Rosa chinensis TaxID=74649 RepID=A0A2P6SGZ4_ROSCH|nr:hypothetical protein RchiOBHm_Chr1g0353801 [Rosa chinensis]